MAFSKLDQGCDSFVCPLLTTLRSGGAENQVRGYPIPPLHKDRSDGEHKADKEGEEGLRLKISTEVLPSTCPAPAPDCTLPLIICIISFNPHNNPEHGVYYLMEKEIEAQRG